MPSLNILEGFSGAARGFDQSLQQRLLESIRQSDIKREISESRRQDETRARHQQDRDDRFTKSRREEALGDVAAGEAADTLRFRRELEAATSSKERRKLGPNPTESELIFGVNQTKEGEQRKTRRQAKKDRAVSLGLTFPKNAGIPYLDNIISKEEARLVRVSESKSADELSRSVTESTARVGLTEATTEGRTQSTGLEMQKMIRKNALDSYNADFNLYKAQIDVGVVDPSVAVPPDYSEHLRKAQEAANLGGGGRSISPDGDQVFAESIESHLILDSLDLEAQQVFIETIKEQVSVHGGPAVEAWLRERGWWR